MPLFKCEPNFGLSSLRNAKDNHAFLAREVRGQKTVYVADQDGANALFHPVWVLAAYALDEKWPDVTINFKGSLPNEWRDAFLGIQVLAATQNVMLHLGDANASPDGEQGCRILVADAEPSVLYGGTEKVVEQVTYPGGDAQGLHKLPRLYAMAALVIEAKRSAAVVAMAVSQRGAVLAVTKKSPAESGCAHAEVKALLALKGQLPVGGLFVSTLKPCTMCGGLLRALDLQGATVKYYARDDAGEAANWWKAFGQRNLPNTYALDKDCQHHKALKIYNEKNEPSSFYDCFTLARKAEPQPQEEAQWFNSWVANLNKLPSEVYWVDPKEGLLRGNPPRFKGLIAQLKARVVDMNGLLARLGRFDQKQPTRNDLGLLKPQKDELIALYTKHKEKQREKAYPARTIDFIAAAPPSLALRQKAADAWDRKLTKYDLNSELGSEDELADGIGEKAKPNENVRAVLTHLITILQSQ